MLVTSSEKPQAPDAIKTAKSESLVTQLKERAPNQNINKVTAKQEQVDVLSRWSVRGKLSQALAQAEYSEATLRQMYTALSALANKLNTQTATAKPNFTQKNDVQSTIESMQKLAAQSGSGLNKQLNLRSESDVSVRQLNANIDLLSARPHDEKINLLMGRSGKSVVLNLPANQGEAKNLTNIQNAFARQDISVELDRNNHLLFSTTKEHAGLLDETWIMSGEGVRVAAGNPISVPLVEPSNPLEQLAQVSESNSEIQAHRDKIKQVQQHLRSSILKVQAQRKELSSQLLEIERAATSLQPSELTDLTNSIGDQMFYAGTNSISTIMAQANITHSLVRYSLY
ncbi:flagellin [Colwellia sp. 20A7]|uniref:flagellin n=1 Tax=Colwellia sp. 20A7 TaxID=2689569 RepID=UPI001357CF2C|nr:flagellin [Colwellia sp. 20A7]